MMNFMEPLVIILCTHDWTRTNIRRFRRALPFRLGYVGIVTESLDRPPTELYHQTLAEGTVGELGTLERTQRFGTHQSVEFEHT